MDYRELISDLHNILQAAQCFDREIKGGNPMQAASFYLNKVKFIPSYTAEVEAYYKSVGREATNRALVSKASQLSDL